MTRHIVLSLIVAAVLLASALVVALTPRVSAFDPGGPPVGGAAPSVVTGNWEWINYQPTGGSYSPQNQINKGNVQFLETKWVFPFPHAPAITGRINEAYGAKAPTLIVDGIAYVAAQDRRIFAIDAGNGRLLWSNDYPRTSWNLTQARILAGPAIVGATALISGDIHAMNYYRDKGWLIPQVRNCMVYAVDAKTGKTVWNIEPWVLCGTAAEFGGGNVVGAAQGTIAGGFQGTTTGHAHPPQFLGNIMFVPIGGGSGNGGRPFVTAFDMSNPQNPQRLYREFLQPPPSGDPEWAIKECAKVNGNGWYFEYPRYLESVNYPARDRAPTYQATKCTDVPADVVRNDGIDLVPGSPTFGKMHTATNFGSAVWGNYPMDPETGLVYIGWGDQGPYTNLTHRYGPNIHGSGLTVHDVRTGKMVWWFQSVIHDLWDYDCAWSGILGQVQGKKAYIKGCKDGIVRAMDAATGQPLWTFDPPTILRNAKGQNYGVGSNNRPTDADACCRLIKEHMSKPWMHYPSKEQILLTCYTTCLESDIAYDGKNVYIGSFNAGVMHTVTNVRPFGNQGVGALGGEANAQLNPAFTNNTNIRSVTNTNIYAVDVNTGRQVWTFRQEDTSFRGGLSISGGMVIYYDGDGNLKFLDTDNGKVLAEKFYGFPVRMMPTVGASKDGKMKIFLYVGSTASRAAWLPASDGTLVALGLPDQLPQAQVITKEVIKEVPKEVIKEVIKEVPGKEVIKEVIKEVPGKEVTSTVTVETISPISYAAIGIGVVLVVISGVLFSRKKKA
ncbi:MAG: PQQ-binding-like beta-propeller repeat protein [Thaumarchaeota archaeon]|nr:PQQ-binding-like beta-propeller repeat protein [Nitrososphaerota archaeon]